MHMFHFVQLNKFKWLNLTLTGINYDLQNIYIFNAMVFWV